MNLVGNYLLKRDVKLKEKKMMKGIIICSKEHDGRKRERNLERLALRTQSEVL